jgi:hypothetical protein
MTTEKEVREEPRVEQPEGEKRDLYWYLDRIWTEIKEVSSQIESETRRGGRIAKLRFELRGLRREFDETAARIGHLVFEAQLASGKRPALARIEEYDELFGHMVHLQSQIDAKEELIAELRQQEEAEAATSEA